MPLRIGTKPNTNISNAYIGVDPVIRIYAGTEQIFPATPETDPVTLTSANPYQGGISFVLPTGDTTSTFTFIPIANPQGYPISMDISIGGTVRAVVDTFSDYLEVSFAFNYLGTFYGGAIADDIVIPTAS